MASPVICIRDAAISNNSFQITDLWPNRAQANPVLDPAPQGPRYLRQPENVLPVLDGGLIVREVSGLAAYLLANIDDGAGAAISEANAKTIADAIIAEMRDGGELTVAALNGFVDATVAGAGVIGTDTSSGSLADILSILAGAKFTLPAGYEVEAAGAFVPAVNADLFDSTVFSPVNENDSSFWISLARGQLRKAISSNTNPRTGAAVDPLVVVYLGDGTVAQ